MNTRPKVKDSALYIRVSSDMLKALKRTAEKREMTVSALVIQALIEAYFTK